MKADWTTGHWQETWEEKRPLNKALVHLILVASITHSLVRAGNAENEFSFTADSRFHDKSLHKDRH